MYKTIGNILLKLLDHIPGLLYTLAGISGASWVVAIMLHWAPDGPQMSWLPAFFVPFACLSILASCVWIGVIGNHIEKNKYEYIQLVNNWVANMERKALPPANERKLVAESLAEVEDVLTNPEYARKR